MATAEMSAPRPRSSSLRKFIAPVVQKIVRRLNSYAAVRRLAKALPRPILRCGFCGLEHASGRRFVSGRRTYICEACVHRAVEILAKSDAAVDPLDGP